jgi:MFS family permease
MSDSSREPGERGVRGGGDLAAGVSQPARPAQAEVSPGKPAVSARSALLPLALAQFICSFAGSNMTVMISDISKDLDTTVEGVQITITLFLLCMAVLMLPGSKLTARWGRKRCFTVGLTLYGIGAAASALAPGLGVLILGNSLFEGVGSALLIPPVYILTTMVFSDLTSRARAFGVINGMAGVGAAAGPLIGGLITTAVSWRAAFLFQAAVVVAILLLSRRITDPVAADPTRPFDTVGAILSAVGMFFVVVGILQAGSNGLRMALFLVLGAGFLLWFFLYIRSRERAGKEALLSTGLFRNRTSNLALVTQNIQWLVLMGTAFVVSAFLQVVRDFSAIKTGAIFTAATAGILASSLAAERLAKRYAQRTLIIAGFIVTVVGVGLLVGLVLAWSSVLAFVPGLLLIGLGVGVMLTPSVNVVQSSFGEDEQDEISGVSRSVSNLGSSLGTAIAGTILVAALASGRPAYTLAMVALAVIALAGLVAATRLPDRPVRQRA